MLRYRLLLGPVLILLLLGVLWFDAWLDEMALPGMLSELLERKTWPPGTAVFLLVAALAVMAARELAAMLKSKKIAASSSVNTVAALVGLGVLGLVPYSVSGVEATAVLAGGAIAVLVGSIAYFSRHHNLEGVITSAGGAALAFVYLGMALGFIVLLRREYPAAVLLWVLMVTKCCDIGAYFTGTAIGRHKLIPWLSPGKTWEGLIGGVLFSALVGALGAWMLTEWGSFELKIAVGAVLGAILGLVGQVGDLMASALKRDAGQKDSGGSLPGFGGVIDVLDSPLLVAPVAFWMLALVG